MLKTYKIKKGKKKSRFWSLPSKALTYKYEFIFGKNCQQELQGLNTLIRFNFSKNDYVGLCWESIEDKIEVSAFYSLAGMQSKTNPLMTLPTGEILKFQFNIDHTNKLYNLRLETTKIVNKPILSSHDHEKLKIRFFEIEDRAKNDLAVLVIE